EWTPLMATQTRAAWAGPYTGRPELSVRVEAASFHGLPVYFQVLWPWTRSTRLTTDVPSAGQTLRNVGLFALAALVLIAAVGIARYNWKAGRGDVRGANRLGIFGASMSLIAWFVRAHHVASAGELSLVGEAFTSAAFVFAEYFVLYLALEP